MYTSQVNSLKKETAAEAKTMLKDGIRNLVTKLETDAFFSWLINFNPMMV